MDSSGTKMIELLIIVAILLIILIVVVVRSSETRVESFSALSDDNYATGLYLSKVLCGQHLDKMIDHIFINNVSLIDYLIPNGMILACTNDLSVLPTMVNWEKLKDGYFIRSSSKENVGTIDTGTTVGSHGNILSKGIITKENDTGTNIGTLRTILRTNDKPTYIILDNKDTTRDEPPSVSIALFKKQSSKQHETCSMSIQVKSITIDSSSIFNTLFGIGLIMLSTNDSWANMEKKTYNESLIKTGTNMDMGINNTNSKGWQWLESRVADDVSSGIVFLKSVSSAGWLTEVRNIKVHELNNTQSVTNFPLTKCVNIFSKTTNRTASKKSVDETNDPIEGNFIKGMKMGELIDIHTGSITGKNGKSIINRLYPVGTVLLFMVDIDLSKQWPGTTWELFEGYIGTSNTTKPGAVFGADEIKLIDASNPPLIIKDTRSPNNRYVFKDYCAYYTVDKVNTQSFSNKLPHYCVRAYIRTA